MKKQKGLGLIGILIIIGALIITTGRVLVWQKKVSPTPTPTPTPKPQPTSEPSPPVEVSGDPYSWPIEKVCVPSCDLDRFCPSRDKVQDLGDGTYVYRRPDGGLFRGTQNQCRCLASTTLISTPDGEKPVKGLKPGMLVWTLDRNGKKVIASIVKASKVRVPDNHLVSYLILADGRELFASPEHPTTDGRTLSQLSPGDILDGARAIKVALVPYQSSYTYDLLPAGETGFYWANGILLKSTLAE